MTRFRRFWVTLVVTTALTLPLAAAAQIAPGTTLTGHIDTGFDSKSAQVGQRFLLHDVHSSNYDINGATVYGHVSAVQRAGQGTNATISLSVDKINTRSGNIYKVVAYVSDMKVETKSNALKEVGGGAAGALVGGLIGHGVGAVIGAAGGALYAKNSRENVTIPQGSLVTVQIASSSRVQQRAY